MPLLLKSRGEYGDCNGLINNVLKLYEGLRSCCPQRKASVTAMKNWAKIKRKKNRKGKGEEGKENQPSIKTRGKMEQHQWASPAQVRVRHLRMREESALAGTRRGSWRRNGTKRSCCPWVWCPGPLHWSSHTKKMGRRRRRMRMITRGKLLRCQTSSGQQWKSIRQIVSIEQSSACLCGSVAFLSSLC